MSQSITPKSARITWGAVALIGGAIVLKSALGLAPSPAAAAAETSSKTAQVTAQAASVDIRTFENIYEPSAVFQLPDGHILVVEDEIESAMSLLTIAPDGRLLENKAANHKLIKSFGHKLDDLENLAGDNHGRIFAATSHSSNKKGDRDPNREQLLRFTVKNGQAQNIARVTSLRDELRADKTLADAIKAKSKSAPHFSDLNIEGMAYLPKNNTLLLGLRAPMAGNLSIIVPITNIDAMFDQKAKPNFGAPIFLDLDGGGIRSLHFDEHLNTFIIANEITNDKGKDVSQIWTWGGTVNDVPKKVAIPQLNQLKNIEAIDDLIINGQKKLVFMADEGVEKKDIPAKYMIVDYSQFSNS